MQRRYPQVTLSSRVMAQNAHTILRWLSDTPTLGASHVGNSEQRREEVAGITIKPADAR